MRRWQSIAVLVIGTVLWSVQPAYANLWDWLQEFSGPGPYHARFPNFMADLCPDDGALLRDFQVKKQDLARSEGDEGQHVTCFFADLRFFANNDNDNFGVKKVHVDIIEVGASARLHRAISLGFGGGLMRISTPDHTAYKGVLTGPRLIVKPFLLYGSNSFWQKSPARQRWYYLLGSIKYYVKEDVALGHVRGKDFGLQPGDANFNFDVQNDRVASTGFIVDVTDLVKLAIRK